LFINIRIPVGSNWILFLDQEKKYMFVNKN